MSEKRPKVIAIDEEEQADDDRYRYAVCSDCGHDWRFAGDGGTPDCPECGSVRTREQRKG